MTETSLPLGEVLLPGDFIAVFGCTDRGRVFAELLDTMMATEAIVFVDAHYDGDQFGAFAVHAALPPVPHATTELIFPEPDHDQCQKYEDLGFYNLVPAHSLEARQQAISRLAEGLISGTYFRVINHDKLPLNQDVRFSRFVQETEDWTGLNVVDIGARGGLSVRWQEFGTKMHAIGFEPAATECEIINAKADKIRAEGGPSMTFYPVGLAAERGERTFYECLYTAASGIYPIRSHYFPERFVDRGHMSFVKSYPVDCVAFRDFMKDNGLTTEWDVVKIDTEGAEHDILKGFDPHLDSVICLETEFALNVNLREGTVFNIVDAFLTERGFILYDMWTQRYMRCSLNYDHPISGGLRDVVQKQRLRSAAPNLWDGGQALSGDAVYFRDPVPDIKAGKTEFWTRARLIKVMSLFESYMLNDCAMEVLEVADCFTDAEKTHFRELLVPPLACGTYVTYDTYQKASKLHWFLYWKDRMPNTVRLTGPNSGA